jgi:hypothetical protein
VHRASIISAAARNNVPAVYTPSESARDGGLLSYGVDQVDIYRRAASYVDRILRGAKPSDLPVQFPTKFEMVLNRKTATALGLAIPPSIMLRADESVLPLLQYALKESWALRQGNTITADSYGRSVGIRAPWVGLVEVTRRFVRILKSALEGERLCSGDPVCADHDPTSAYEVRALHGAACHGCLPVAETSCEARNLFLDRALIVETVAQAGAGFFLKPHPCGSAQAHRPLQRAGVNARSSASLAPCLAFWSRLEKPESPPNRIRLYGKLLG